MSEKKQKKLTIRKAIKRFFRNYAYEDYSFAENDGYVDHEGLMCKKCPLLLEKEKDAIEHLKEDHSESFFDWQRSLGVTI